MLMRDLFKEHSSTILNKMVKSSKTGQGKKSLISTFACFLTVIATAGFFSGGETGRCAMFPP